MPRSSCSREPEYNIIFMPFISKDPSLDVKYVLLAKVIDPLRDCTHVWKTDLGNSAQHVLNNASLEKVIAPSAEVICHLCKNLFADRLRIRAFVFRSRSRHRSQRVTRLLQRQIGECLRFLVFKLCTYICNGAIRTIRRRMKKRFDKAARSQSLSFSLSLPLVPHRL